MILEENSIKLLWVWQMSVESWNFLLDFVEIFLKDSYQTPRKIFGKLLTRFSVNLWTPENQGRIVALWVVDYRREFWVHLVESWWDSPSISIPRTSIWGSAGYLKNFKGGGSFKKIENHCTEAWSTEILSVLRLVVCSYGQSLRFCWNIR